MLTRESKLKSKILDVLIDQWKLDGYQPGEPVDLDALLRNATDRFLAEACPELAQQCVESTIKTLLDEGTKIEVTVGGNFEELRGKNLACWCPLGSPCHADVLLELANKRKGRSSTPRPE